VSDFNYKVLDLSYSVDDGSPNRGALPDLKMEVPDLASGCVK